MFRFKFAINGHNTSTTRPCRQGNKPIFNVIRTKHTQNIPFSESWKNRKKLNLQESKLCRFLAVLVYFIQYWSIIAYLFPTIVDLSQLMSIWSMTSFPVISLRFRSILVYFSQFQPILVDYVIIFKIVDLSDFWQFGR